MQRKRIAVLTAYPEGIYCQRAFEGIFTRCRQYGYDTAVFAQSANICDRFKEYLYGEKNIYELINYERVDGVIILPMMFDECGKNVILSHVLDRIRRECRVPVVSLD